MMQNRTLLRTALFMGLVLALCGFVMGQKAPMGSHPNTEKWQDLFKPDLSNALVGPGSWVFENGELFAKDHSTIWTKESYGNFELDLEFKVSKGANSGVFLRTGDIKNVLTGLEIQIHENTDGSRIGMVGSIYDCLAPSKSVAKPVGEWNRYTITCRDSKVSLVFNAEKVIDADLNDWTEAHKNPDGTPNKFAVALKDFSRVGPIGFQGLHGKESAPVWYRNLKINVLK